MVTEQDINELKKFLESFRRMVGKLNSLNQMNWKVSVEVPYTGGIITHDVPDAKKQQIIRSAIDKRKVLKAKIDNIDWTSLD